MRKVICHTADNTSSIVQIIFSFWSFEIREGILRNQKIIIGLIHFLRLFRAATRHNISSKIKLRYLRGVSIFPNLETKVCHNNFIRKTCPCNVYPLKPHFYIVKMGNTGVYLFFLFLLQNIDCGYSLEPTIYVLSKTKKYIKNLQLKIFNF